MGLEKWIFNRYETSPLKMVFLEEGYGAIVMVPLTITFQYVSCPWHNKEACVEVDGHYYLENISHYFH